MEEGMGRGVGDVEGGRWVPMLELHLEGFVASLGSSFLPLGRPSGGICTYI